MACRVVIAIDNNDSSNNNDNNDNNSNDNNNNDNNNNDNNNNIVMQKLTKTHQTKQTNGYKARP